MRRRTLIITVLIVALACAAPLASSSPDGLERVAQDAAMSTSDQPVWNHAPIADYQMPGVRCGGLATSLAGAFGAVVVLATGLLLGRVLTRRSAP